MPVPQSESLKLKIRLAEPRMVEPLIQFANHPEFRSVFIEYVFRLHCAIRASVPLLENALERARELAKRCPVASALVPYYRGHIGAEAHHDEWLLDDMVHLGVDRNQFLARVPPGDVASMVGAQYYWINHTHPVALLGYLAVIEGNPITVEALDRIVEAHSIPKPALRTFYLHARDDIEHSAEIWQCIDDLPLLPFHNVLLGLSAMLAVDQMANTVESILKTVDDRATGAV